MKNILFVTYDFPYPTNTGGKNRAYHMLKYSGPKFNKYLFSFVRRDFKEEYKKAMGEIEVETIGTYPRRKVVDPRNIVGLLTGKSIFHTLYYSKFIQEKILEEVRSRKIDIIHFESFYTGFYISESLRQLGVKQVYGSENIEHKLYDDYIKSNVSGILKSRYKNQVVKIEEEEILMYKNSDACLAVTQDEVNHIKKYTKKCFLIPNGIDIDDFVYSEPEKKQASNLLFVGNFTYFPNVTAMNSFYNNVFKSLPENVRLTVIGKKVNSLAFTDQRIEKVEFIPDIKDAYKNADILISPITIGGGTNFKILEAMAAGVPVIAYGGRLDAVGAEDGKHVVVVENESEFGDKIIKLLGGLEFRKKLSGNARKLVEEKYSWKIIGRELAKVWENL